MFSYELFNFDFAYSPTMLLIVFLYNAFFLTFLTYLTTNIILEIYQQPASFKQKSLFSFWAGTLTHSLYVYGIYIIVGFFILKVGTIAAGSGDDLYQLVTVTNPIYVILLYVLGIKYLNLSRFSSIKIMRLSYVYYLFCMLITKAVFIALFPMPKALWTKNPLIDFLTLLADTLVIYILYKVVMYIVRRTYVSVAFTDNIVVDNIRWELLKNFVYALLIYILIESALFYEKLDLLHYLFLIVSLFMYLTISIFMDYIATQQIASVNKDVHIASLSKTLNDFQSIKRDFFNILQTYTGYLYIKNYEKLSHYHQSILKMAKLEEPSIDIPFEMHENPAFYALLLNKLDVAAKKGVSIQLNILSSPQAMDIADLDYCRVLGILLDNALEAAEITESKKVSLSIEDKTNNSKLIILSNNTRENVDTKQIMMKGFTTKPDHTGQGLDQARSILSKYGNCTLNANYYNYEFTVYLEIRSTESFIEKKPRLYLIKGSADSDKSKKEENSVFILNTEL